MQYIPFQADDVFYDDMVAKNGTAYKEMIEVLGQKRSTNEDKSENPLGQSDEIDFERHRTHRIFDVAKECSENINTAPDNNRLLRRCKFSYKEGKGGQRVYEKKTLDLMVDLYPESNAKQGKKIASCELDLCQYMNKGQVVQCIPLKSQFSSKAFTCSAMILTVQIEVAEKIGDSQVPREEEPTTLAMTPTQIETVEEKSEPEKKNMLQKFG